MVFAFIGFGTLCGGKRLATGDGSASAACFGGAMDGAAEDDRE